MRVGYVRVSSLEQNTARQLEGVEVERTFTDRASGKDTARPKLAEMLAFVREGDTVLVHSMDRLARNLEDLRGLVRQLTGKGVRVEFVKESLVFTGEDSPMATLPLSVMGAFAEFERALILERQREGIAAARQRGAYTGRKPALTTGQARELRERAAAGEAPRVPQAEPTGVTDGDIWPSRIGTWPLSLRLADLQFRRHLAGSRAVPAIRPIGLAETGGEGVAPALTC